MSLVVTLALAVAIPLAIAAFLLRGGARLFLTFMLVGVVVCLLSAYVNAYFMAGDVTDELDANVRLTPIVEETLKALPVFFFLAVIARRRADIVSVAMAVGLGFALLENVSYLVSAPETSLLAVAVVRGFATGVLHAACGALLGYGLGLAAKQRYLAVPVALGLLCLTATFHAIYNLFVEAGGAWSVAGYLLPIAIAVVIVAAVRHPLFVFDD